MRDLNLRNIALMALVISCFLQIGAQLFAISTVASTIVEAPPRSFAIIEGPHRYDSSAFWSTVPPITAILFVVGLFANWTTPRRKLLIIAFALFLIAGVLAGVLVEPEYAAITAVGYSDQVDPALQSRAASWLAYDWGVWGISLLAGIAALLALARPSSSPADKSRSKQLLLSAMGGKLPLADRPTGVAAKLSSAHHSRSRGAGSGEVAERTAGEY